MTTLHIENRVQDFGAWKAAFDRFDRFRAEQKVRSYRMTRDVEDPNRVTVDLQFDSTADAESFRVALQKIWASPQSRQQLISHSEPVIRDLVEDRTL